MPPGRVRRIRRQGAGRRPACGQANPFQTTAEPAWPAMTTVTTAAIADRTTRVPTSMSNAWPRGASSCGGRANQSATSVSTMKTRQKRRARLPHSVCVFSRSKFVVLARAWDTRRCSASPLSAATKAETPAMTAPAAVGQRSMRRQAGRTT
jgi:hypothetical protein